MEESYCKPCVRNYVREHYARNKKRYIEKATERRKRTELKIRKLKEKPCTDCKIQYEWYKMSFDHLDPSIKLDNIGTLITRNNLKLLLEEVDKCEVVCLNCHAARTYKRKKSG